MKHFKKPLTLLLTLLLFLNAASLQPMAFTGLDSRLPPGYIAVYTAEDLDKARDDLAGSYYMMSDVDLNSWAEWEPIGTQAEPFTGVFDGNGFAVLGLSVSSGGLAGLFGRAEDGEIMNLTVTDCDISGDVAGGIVGSTSNVTIRNCWASGTVHGTAQTGGIVGSASMCEIAVCGNSAAVSSNGYAGGIAGSMDNTRLESCTNTGRISGLSTGASQYIGGIVGYAMTGGAMDLINDCQNSGEIIAPDGNVGGIAGASLSPISSCTNAGNIAVSGGVNAQVGGIAGGGSAPNLTVSNCKNFGAINVNISGTATVGGISALASEIENSNNSGDIAVTSGGKSDVGGVVGSTGSVTNSRNIGNLIVQSGADANVGGIAGSTASSTKEVANCWNSGDIRVDSVTDSLVALYIGGIVGNGNASIQQCFNEGNIDAYGNADPDQKARLSAGGLAGLFTGDFVTDSWNIGDIYALSGAEDAYAGGIAGELAGTSTLSRCYNTGGIDALTNTHFAFAGGIAGHQGTGPVLECWNIGTVSARAGEDAFAGGIAGQGYAIENSWNAGAVSAISRTGMANIGGISGYLTGTIQTSYNSSALKSEIPERAQIGGISGELLLSATLAHTYYLDETADGAIGTGDWPGATALSDEQMKLQSDYPGFDFAAIWAVTSGYPVLRNNPAARYLVQYDGNGENVTNLPAAQPKLRDTTLQLSEAVPQRIGYTFKGWSTDPEHSYIWPTPPYMPSGNYEVDAGAVLYAVWVPVWPMIVFQGGGGVANPYSIQVRYGSTFEEMPVPVWAGYDFQGWYTEKTGGTKIKPTDKSYLLARTDFYAHWSPARYTVTLDAQGGTSPLDSIVVEYDGFYRPLPTPTRTGYTFENWYSEANGGYRRTENSIVRITEDSTLYAHWEPNRYEVTLVPNYEGANPFDATATYDRTFEGILVNFGQFGHTLVGWFTEPDGGVEYKPTDTVKLLDDITLYAHWQVNNYTITFNSNGGVGDFPDKTVTFGQPHGELPMPTRTNYDFTGWYPHPVWGYEVKAEDIVKEWSDQTLYAHWKGKSHVVTLDCQGGVIEDWPDIVTVYYEETYRDLHDPVRPGYSFQGWYTAKTGGRKVNPTDKVTTFANETLYARWQVKQYTVHFDPWGGTVDGSHSAAKKTVTFDALYGDFPTPINPGYEFKGWYLNSPNSGVEIKEGPVKIAQNHYIYARWEPGTYTIKLDPQGGECDMKSFRATFEESIYVIPEPTRVGYDFEGWFTKKTGGTFVPRADWNRFTEDQTLYAQWTPYTLEGILLFNDEARKVERIPLTFGGTYEELPTPTRVGYTFMGWYIRDGALIRNTDEVTVLDSHFIDACWTANTYTVTLDPGPGRVSPTSVTVTYDQKYGILPQPIREGYRCLSWYTEPGGGRQINETIMMRTAEDHTLYAFWVAEMSNQIDHGPMVLNVRKKAVFEVDGISAMAYHSYNPRVASVDENGNILAKRRGTTRISLISELDMQIHYVDVQVKYSFWQWLAVIFLFGWIWVPVWR